MAVLYFTVLRVVTLLIRACVHCEVALVSRARDLPSRLRENSGLQDQGTIDCGLLHVHVSYVATMQLWS